MATRNMNLITALVLIQTLSWFCIQAEDHPKSCQAKKDGKGEWTVHCQNLHYTEVSQAIKNLLWPDRIVLLDLSGNSLSEIPVGAFQKFKALRTLRLGSQENFTTLTSGCFDGLENLLHLDLSNNRLCMTANDSSYPEDVFQNLHSLQMLNLTMNQCPEGRKHKVYPKALEQLAKSLKTLYITGIPGPLDELFGNLKHLNHLTLSGTQCNLEKIANDSLSYLKNIQLETLVIRDCTITDIDKTAFKDLHHLKNLSVSCSDVTITAVRNALHHLPKNTSLDTLIMDGLGKGTGFWGMSDPDDKSGTLITDWCHIPAIKNLRLMSIRGSQVTAIHLDMFNDCFKNLSYLALGYNNPTQIMPQQYKRGSYRSYVYNVPERFLDISNVNTLDISHLFGATGDYFKGQYCGNFMDVEDHFRAPEYPRDSSNKVHSLEYLYADHMLMALQDSDINSKRNMSKVQVIDWSHNALKRIGQFRGFTDLRLLNLSDNEISFIDHHAFDAESKLEILRLQNNKLEDYDFQLVFRNLWKLKFLDLSDNAISVFHPLAFENLESLEHLLLEYNNLGTEQGDFSQIFKYLTSLQELDLQWNRIQFLEREAFSELKNLRKLNLKGNILFYFHTDLTHMPFLEEINLKRNHLSEIHPEIADELECTKRDPQAKKPLALHLEDNGFYCKCSNVPFFKWLEQTTQSGTVEIANHEELVCTDPERDWEKPKIKDELPRLLENCTYDYGEYYTCNNQPEDSFWKAFLKSAGVGTVSTSFIMIIASIIHHHRFHIRWKYHLFWWKRRQRRHSVYEPLEMEESPSRGESECNGLIVYNKNCQADVDWLFNIFLPRVEGTGDNDFDYKLKLLHGDRDFPKDVPMAQRIVGGAYQAHKVVLVVSPAFIEDSWCRYATKMALMRGRGTILICYREKVDRKDIFIELGLLLQYTDYARYPKPGDSRYRPYPIGIQKFWESVKRQLRIPDPEEALATGSGPNRRTQDTACISDDEALLDCEMPLQNATCNGNPRRSVRNIGSQSQTLTIYDRESNEPGLPGNTIEEMAQQRGGVRAQDEGSSLGSFHIEEMFDNKGYGAEDENDDDDDVAPILP